MIYGKCFGLCHTQTAGARLVVLLLPLPLAPGLSVLPNSKRAPSVLGWLERDWCGRRSSHGRFDVYIEFEVTYRRNSQQEANVD